MNKTIGIFACLALLPLAVAAHEEGQKEGKEAKDASSPA
jgi:hypothetical protein